MSIKTGREREREREIVFLCVHDLILYLDLRLSLMVKQTIVLIIVHHGCYYDDNDNIKFDIDQVFFKSKK